MKAKRMRLRREQKIPKGDILHQPTSHRFKLPGELKMEMRGDMLQNQQQAPEEKGPLPHSSPPLLHNQTMVDM